MKRNKSIIVLIGCCFLLVALFLYFFYIPPATDIGSAQPIPFSHRIHAGVKEIQCAYCHPYVARSNHPGLPPVEKCLHCHKYIIIKHPWIEEEHRYYNTKTPTPWKKVNRLAEHVLFNHQRHINSEIKCRECHGAVETMDRIKGTQFQMGFCINCHQQKKANLGCWLACHS
ncbi:MAG TPA: cytochrome c3 family protein [Deltaproteobacteria bacterium]|nr:cytochrome c3 family protein [Deltaproteobacteria bacterium]